MIIRTYIYIYIQVHSVTRTYATGFSVILVNTHKYRMMPTRIRPDDDLNASNGHTHREGYTVKNPVGSGVFFCLPEGCDLRGMTGGGCALRPKHLRTASYTTTTTGGPSPTTCVRGTAAERRGSYDGGGDGHWSDRLVIRSVLVNAPGAHPPFEGGRIAGPCTARWSNPAAAFGRFSFSDSYLFASHFYFVDDFRFPVSLCAPVAQRIYIVYTLGYITTSHQHHVYPI